MQPQQEPDLIGLHRWLHATLRQHKLATFTNVLLRDAVTTALGVKPAALLDFHLPPPVLELVLQRIHTTDTRLFAPLALITLTSSADTATFLVHRPSFLHTPPWHTASTPFIDVSPSLPSPRLLTEDTAKPLTNQLHGLTSSLSAALTADASVSHVTLHTPPSVCLPSLCGWLLSYPALYTFPPPSLASTLAVVPSINCLSNQPLTLYTVSFHPTAFLIGRSSSFASESGCLLLQSFSVPTGLLSESTVGSALQAWEQRMGEACCSESVSRWIHRLSISKTAVCLPHVSL